MTCPHSKLNASLDRWQECHWHIHQMEENYHSPEEFRYSFNSFIRAVKEIPQIIHMELQNNPKYKNIFKPIIDQLKSETLFNFMHEKRNFIVHQGMLSCLSTGMVGITKGRGVKMGFNFPVYPEETTTEAYKRFKHFCKFNKTIRNTFGPDCDTWPIIIREWKIKEFPETNLLDLATDTWRLVGSTLSNILVELGADSLDLHFSCRHDIESIKKMEFSQEDFFQDVDGININEL